MTGAPEVPDAELVAGVLAADRDAFAAMYDRYGAALYDFAHSMLRQREDAADAVADSFVIVAEKLHQLRDPERLRPWLYAIVRSECLRVLRARKKIAYGDDERFTSMADDALTPDQEAERSAAQKIVWDAAAGLADRDRALLDLHLRQGLEGAELAEAIGVSASNAYVMLNRLRAQVDRSLGALLIARMGRDDCPDLDRVLSDWDGTYSPLVRKRVARHVDDCIVCGERRKAMVAPWAVFGTVPLFAAPTTLRDRVLDTQLVAHSTAGASGATSAHWGKPKAAMIAGAAALVLALAGTASYVAWPDEEPAAQEVSTPSADIAVSPTAAPTTESEPDPETDAEQPATPGTIRVSTLNVDLSAEANSTTITVFNVGGQSVTYQATSDVPWLTTSPASAAVGPGESTTLTLVAAPTEVREGSYTGTLEIAWPDGSIPITVAFTTEQGPILSAPVTVSNPGCSVPVTVSVRDDSRVSTVILRWSGPSGPGTAGMQFSGGLWRAQMGQFFAPGDVTMYAEATDSRGNVAQGPSTTVAMNPCPS